MLQRCIDAAGAAERAQLEQRLLDVALELVQVGRGLGGGGWYQCVQKMLKILIKKNGVF